MSSILRRIHRSLVDHAPLADLLLVHTKGGNEPTARRRKPP